MSKRTLALVITAGLALGTAVGPAAWAQPGRTQKPLALYIGFGYINLSQPPHWLALGPELEWRLAKPLTINPEVALWIADSFRSTLRVVPGITMNLRFGRVFVGGGFVYRIPEWTVDTTSKIVPKLQAGILMGPARLALTVHLPGAANAGRDAVFGLSIATRIGRPGGRAD
ncbi:MAG TPA: hypothetical protein VLJ16_02275 [Acidobacteriota bacterium]|nr:hypothetical protein [Acidobacteriota bacterium]